MKKFLAILTTTFLVASSFAFEPNFDPRVSEKVLKSFNETFTTAEDIKWETFDTYYAVSFSQAGIQSRVNYDKNGSMISSLRYYAPSMLPLNVYNRIKNSYANKEMFGVTEVSFNNEVTYYVKLQDAKTWTTVKVDGAGNAHVVEKYKKAR
ncbi:MAG: hypothetical protein ABW036_06065 [Flavitalea sp.]